MAPASERQQSDFTRTEWDGPESTKGTQREKRQQLGRGGGEGLGETRESNETVEIRKVAVNVLAYANDIILVSESKEGFQKLVDITREWCRKCHMVVNSSNTKVMVFRRKYATWPGVAVIRYGDVELE